MAMAVEQRQLFTNYANGTLCVSGTRRSNSQIRHADLGFGRQRLHNSRVISETPKNAVYATLTARIISFCGWDIQTISSNELAEAGFYYTGIKDCVRCFMCGCGVKDWDRGDKAWIEHARWSPNCTFLSQQKSEEFIRLCQSSNLIDRKKAEQLVLNQHTQQQGDNEDQPTSFTQHSSDDSELPLSVEDDSSITFTSETSSETGHYLGFSDNFWCTACRIRPRDILFVACGHLLFCERCQLHFKYCPACGTNIKPWVKVLWN